MISIVIPAFNEEKHIGNLLESLSNQNFSEDIEIVVADANSTDATRMTAEKYKNNFARLTFVTGGMPAVSRNAGAKASSGEPIFFIDADLTILHPEFLKIATERFRNKKLAVASVFLKPDSQKKIDHILVKTYNAILYLSKFIRPLGAMCIIASREAFNRTGGYPEDVVMAEDHDFVFNCLEHGPYDVIPQHAVFSVRRFDKEGRLGLVGKYLKASAHRVLYGPITKPIFEYKFSYDKDEKRDKDKTFMEDRSKLRVTLYCEYYHFLNGLFFKKPGMGFITSYRNQMKILEKAGIPFTENLKAETDIFQANTQGLRTLWLVKKFKRRGKKIIIYAHATAEELHGGFLIFYFFSGLYKRYLSYLYNLADAVVCPSVYTLGILNEKYGIPKEKTIFISNGIDKNEFASSSQDNFRETHGINSQDIVVINMAMAIKKKGLDTFITLAESFPQVKFIWCGKIFKRFAPEIPSHPSNVIFYGYVDDKTAAYLAADIFLFPSYEENQGISVLEAGIAGLPILIRDIPVYSGWLEDGKHCLKAKDNEEFRRKLACLIEDKDLRQVLGKTAQQMISREHGLEAIGQKLYDLYATLLTVKTN